MTMFAYCYGIFMFFIVFNDDDLMGCFKGHVPMLHVPLLHHRGDRPLPHQHHQQSGQSLIHFKQVTSGSGFPNSSRWFFLSIDHKKRREVLSVAYNLLYMCTYIEDMYNCFFSIPTSYISIYTRLPATSTSVTWPVSSTRRGKNIQGAGVQSPLAGKG